ncbi:MAG: TetR family transcriptional regulator [Acidimicrobiales bacterium]
MSSVEAAAPSTLSDELRARRAAMVVGEVEAVALRLFEKRTLDDVTVEEIATAAHISPRTFYRYFRTKDDVLQVRIDRRSEALAAALERRPADEPPLQSVREALEEVVGAEDTDLVRRWCDVVAGTPSLLRGVLGGIHLKSNRTIAVFLGRRLGMAAEDLVPTMLAAAVAGVVQAAQTRWYVEGGDLATAMSAGLAVLERAVGGDPATWSSRPAPRR